jgi:hypothetical protein
MIAFLKIKWTASSSILLLFWWGMGMSFSHIINETFTLYNWRYYWFFISCPIGSLIHTHTHTHTHTCVHFIRVNEDFGHLNNWCELQTTLFLIFFLFKKFDVVKLIYLFIYLRYIHKYTLSKTEPINGSLEVEVSFSQEFILTNIFKERKKLYSNRKKFLFLRNWQGIKILM